MSFDQTPKRIVIKIGSSSLTSQHGEISRRKLENFVEEVVLLKEEGHEVLLVSSGAVAAGYRKLGCLNRPTDLAEKQAAAAIGQGLLIEAYSDLFLSHGYVGSQILITRSDFSDEDRYINARNTMNVLLGRGIIPIVNENDTVTTQRLNFGDNDTLSAKVAGLLNADLLIILSDIEGLYDDDPRSNPNAKLIPRVTEITPEIEAVAGEPGSSVGTGGMRSKIDAAKIAMASGITTFIGRANQPQILLQAANREALGTYFESDSEIENLTGKQQWIAFNSGPEGEVIIENEAHFSITEDEESLFPADIDHVRGTFEAGAVVQILHANGEDIGLGVVNFSSHELRAFTLMPKQDVEKIRNAAVKRDHLVCHQDYDLPVGL